MMTSRLATMILLSAGLAQALQGATSATDATQAQAGSGASTRPAESGVTASTATRPAQHQGQGGDLQRASNVLNAEIRSQSGGELGTIKDLAVDADRGQVAYVVLQRKAENQQLYAVPWSVLQVSTEGGLKFTANIDSQRLDRVEGFEENNWPDMSDPGWARYVARQFGGPAYGEDDRRERRWRDDDRGGAPFWQQERGDRDRSDMRRGDRSESRDRWSDRGDERQWGDRWRDDARDAYRDHASRDDRRGFAQDDFYRQDRWREERRWQDQSRRFDERGERDMGMSDRRQDQRWGGDTWRGDQRYGQAERSRPGSWESDRDWDRERRSGTASREDRAYTDDPFWRQGQNPRDEQRRMGGMERDRYDDSRDRMEWRDRGPTRLLRPNIVRASHLMGTDVKSRQGSELGDVEDFVIHVRDGRIAYAVLSLVDSDKAGQYYAVPWQAVRVARQADELVVDIPRSRLQRAPGFGSSEWPDMADSQWARELYEYFGFEPDWVIYSFTIYGEPISATRPAGAGDSSPYHGKFDPSTSETVSGQVVSFTKTKPMTGTSRVVALGIRTDNGRTRTVHLAPYGFVKRTLPGVAVGQPVTVTGSKVSIDGEEVIMAREVRHQESSVQLRDQNGRPLWGSQSTGGRDDF